MNSKNTCPLCGSRADTRQATESRETYAALDVDCAECGLLRVSGKFLRLKKHDNSWAAQLRKVLGKRDDVEKKMRVWVTTDGISPCKQDKDVRKEK